MDEEGALAAAREADAARAAGKAGRLLGVPVAVKDVLNVKGQPCSCASRILEGYTAPYDATAVARLRAAGAVFLGRANMDEFAMGSSTENSALRRHPQPVGPGPRPRRFERRLGRRRGRPDEAIAALARTPAARSASRPPSAAASA